MSNNNSNDTGSDAAPAPGQNPTSEEQMQLYLERERKEKEMRETLTKEWAERLVGKRYVEHHNEGDGESVLDENSFNEASLREPFRVLKGEHAMMTMDYRPDRLNVQLDNDGVCTGVFFV
ncbi:hypothetical protein GGI23_000333 [Coemansia sp. RSA 2559]|nr:hypothetical protein GGI23_000333 [Coemansia sp. RSA 2559]KAJ2868769.1 hypothetical protein GGI22_000661 [Coemansia erecta]